MPFYTIDPMNYHLVILKKPYIDAILAGRKTVESRFYQTNQKWLSRIAAGDKLFLKASSGPVMATATVGTVKVYDNLNPAKIEQIRAKHNHQILGDEKYWQEKSTARFGLLCRLKNICPITPQFIRKFDWRAWVVLSKTEHFGLVNFE
jgi:ASC-1-like (ASCH) protein